MSDTNHRSARLGFHDRLMTAPDLFRLNNSRVIFGLTSVALASVFTPGPAKAFSIGVGPFSIHVPGGFRGGGGRHHHEYHSYAHHHSHGHDDEDTSDDSDDKGKSVKSSSDIKSSD